MPVRASLADWQGIKITKPPAPTPAPRRFKFGYQQVEGILATDPERVTVVMGNTPETSIEFSSAHCFFELPDGFKLEVYAGELQPTQGLTCYRKGDKITLGGLITNENIFHVIDTPMPPRERRFAS